MTKALEAATGDLELRQLGQQFDELAPRLSAAYERDTEIDDAACLAATNAGAGLPEAVYKVLRASIEIELDRPAALEEIDRLGSEMERLQELIRAMRATTFEGFRVKARAAIWCVSGELPPTCGDEAEDMNWSIVRDLIAA